MQNGIINNKISLPWWTWLAPFLIFYTSAYVSHQLEAPTGLLFFYLPIPIGIILIHWWGPRVLVGLLISSLFNSALLENDFLTFQPLAIFSEVACVAASWYLFSYWQRGKIWLPDIFSLLLFIALGIIIPVTLNSFVIYLVSHSAHENIWEHLTMVWTADSASCLALTVPTLFFLTPGMEQIGLTMGKGSEYVGPNAGFRLLRPHRIEIIISFTLLLALIVLFPPVKYWFVHGLFSVYIGVRFGFGFSLLANMAVFLFVYGVPYLIEVGANPAFSRESDFLNAHFGMCLLQLTACVTGRVISDLKSVQRTLNQQFKELAHTHDELDRFVYSASHDLSAPLKTILGLITVSRLEPDKNKHYEYIDKIEKSAIKLDSFIKEILDYSRNSRLEEHPELINLRDLIDEVLLNLGQHERLNQINIKILDDEVPQLVADRMRMKIILRSLLSNAVRYQQPHSINAPAITIQSEALSNDRVLIHIKDNGNGIPQDHLPKIFKMFFRGTLDSDGSGLGLYIAKEAAEKMDGKITVTSEYGKGSNFTVNLPGRS